MKYIYLSLSLFLSCKLNAQHASISVDKMNILYVGIENPLTITAENSPCSTLIIKPSLGEITLYDECSFLYKSSVPGRNEISVYKKLGKQIKRLAVFYFRVQKIPDPVFKIGPYGIENTYGVYKDVLAAQQFVRADLENFDFDARFRVDSFRIKIVSNDSCKIKTFSIISNLLPDEVRKEFNQMQESDFIVFDRIFAIGPDGLTRRLKPIVLTIEDRNFKN